MPTALNTRHLGEFIAPQELAAMGPQVLKAHRMLAEKSGPGSDFLGWMTLPGDYDRQELAALKEAAERIKNTSEVLLVVGIGGSYLGARAAIEFLTSPFYNGFEKDTPDIYFVGNNLSPTYLREIVGLCTGRDVSINVVSKSGTTTEPAVAFRYLKEYLEARFGLAGARERIYCTTDRAKGTLKELADRMGYTTFVIPDDVGGRYSVLTPVGLLPMAVAGIDIDQVLAGAGAAMEALGEEDLLKNDCYRYAAIRNILHKNGKEVELLASYEPSFAMMGQWYLQLFGESEGKDGKGIFPATVNFSTDLHSMGQYIQEGQRFLFETVVDIQKPALDCFIKEDPTNFDGLNFLAGQNMSEVNRKAMEGTILAHTQGGVPNLVLEVPCISPYEYGYFVYFMEKACAMSGYLLGVNPFDQPGVESYKRNMFALLGKPGYEALRADLEGQLAADRT